MVNRRSLSKLLSYAKTLEGSALVTWYITDDEEGPLTNLRNVRLLILTRDNIRILPGTVTRNQFGDQQLLFASTGLCRIRTGRRRGMIVEPHRLRIGEDATDTGLIKPLSQTSTSNGLHMDDGRDEALVLRLCDSLEEAVELSDIVAPDAYVRTRSANNLTLRLAGEVTKKLMETAGYDKNLPMDDNFTNLIEQFSRRAAERGYKLYPFDMVRGNGLIVIDMESAPPPLLVPLDGLDTETTTLRIKP